MLNIDSITDQDLQRLFQHRSNCWTQHITGPDDEIGTEMAMSEDRFVEVVRSLLEKVKGTRQ